MLHNRFKGLVHCLAGVCLVLATGRIGRADDIADLKKQIDQQNKQIEQQNKQLQGLKARIDAPGASHIQVSGEEAAPRSMEDISWVQKIIDDTLKEKDKQKKEAEEKAKQKIEEEGFRVGSDLKMNVRWNPVNGVTFETPNKDFTSHLGARFQEDTNWFSQTPSIKAAPAGAAGGIGPLQDGTFFRRLRPSWDGTAWEVIEWKIELAMEQTGDTDNQGMVGLDEVWVGVTQLPILGSIRVGHLKVPQGFEGDMVSSSQGMTFLERASYTDAFYQNFAPGLWTGNSVLDQHLTWSAMWYRPETNLHGSNGADFGDGNYAYSGRLTALPIYENDGRHWLHLGGSATWRRASNADPVDGAQTVRFRARPMMRDFQGDFGSLGLSGNSNRMVDTGALTASSTTILGTEFCYVVGPFSVQAEYAWASADATTSGALALGDLWFHGGYVQFSYFLTGENRVYDRRLGRLGSTYIERPYTPFWLVNDEGGGWSLGRGAWEFATRFSHLDLNNGFVNGGEMDGIEAGLNWYLSNNLKVQFEYLYNNRFNGASAAPPGNVNAFGTRVQFFF